MSEKELYCQDCGVKTNDDLGIDGQPICKTCYGKRVALETAKYKPKLVDKQSKTTGIKAFSSRFEYVSPIAVTESFNKGRTIISGTLLSEGLSGNGNLYTIDVLETLDGLKDIPIYVGTGQNNKHTKAGGVIGKILKTTFDKVARKVKFIAEIFNETIAKSVKSGWGISIGGQGKGEYVLDSLGKLITRVKRLALYHVQLLMPTTKRGMDSAQVENVQIQESMIFRDVPRLTKAQIAKIIGVLVAEGEI
jgi:hypothetical protein